MTVGSASASPVEDVDKIWTAYRVRWASTSSYQATFRQRIEITGIGSDVTSGGMFYFSRPDLMRWDYTEGQEQNVIGDGEWVWVYQPDLEQAYRIEYKAAFGSGGLVALLADREGLSKRYRLELVDRNDESVRLRLMPREGAGETLELEMSSETMDLRSVVVTDPAGSVTFVEFIDARRNGEVDPELFVFTPPDGVDIISSPNEGG
jgi:chaperone LolA